MNPETQKPNEPSAAAMELAYLILIHYPVKSKQPTDVVAKTIATLITEDFAPLVTENAALKKELNLHARTLSIFSANIPANAEADRTYVAGRLSEAHKLGCVLNSVRPYDEAIHYAQLRTQNEALTTALNDLFHQTSCTQAQDEIIKNALAPNPARTP